MTEKQKQRTVPLSLRWLYSAKHQHYSCSNIKYHVDFVDQFTVFLLD